MTTTTVDDPMAVLQENVRRSRKADEATRAVQVARVQMICDRTARGAFFSTLALRLKLVPDWSVETAATDGRKLLYNPDWFLSLPKMERIGVVAHEVMHLAMSHHARLGAREPKKGNVAMDLAINHILKENSYALPKEGCFPGEGRFKDLPKGESFERYYNLLPDEPGGGGGAGSGNDPGGCGGVIPAKDAATAQQQQAEWAAAVAQANQAAKQRGTLGGELGRMVDEIVEPAVDWKAVLREFIQCHAKNDYSWARPNRRFISQGLYLPSLYSEELGHIVVAIDTSGSIGAKELDQFAAELASVLECCPSTLTILYHDSAVAHVQHWEASDGPLLLEPKGGGGTSHVCCFDWIKEHGDEPVCLVCLTDMCSSFPDEGPGYPVLWCSTEKGHTAPFGRLLEIDLS